MPKGWDGKVYMITESGYFKMGHLPEVVSALLEHNLVYKFDDKRIIPEFMGIPAKVASDSLRGYQLEAVTSVVTNKLGDIKYPVGIINAATNAGKTIMMMAIHLSYKKAKSIILLNDLTLYKQFVKDLPKVFKEGDWGYVQGKNVKWGKQVTVAMVQSLVSNLSRFKSELTQVDIALIDECDLSTSKTYRKVITELYNASIRVGLSGTVFLSKLKKDELKNQEVRAYLGSEVYKIKNVELVELGVSTPPVIKIVKGDDSVTRRFSDYPTEYKQLITDNNLRHAVCLDRVRFNLYMSRSPMLVVCIYHDHVHNLFNYLKENLEPGTSIEYVHHEVKNRDVIIEKFREGKLDILVSSMIIKRGQNMPLIRYILNAGGGDSAANVLQVLGRGLRKSETKKKIYVDDIFDFGKYCQRHSKHRVNYYKNEQIKVIKLFK
jgi:ATP-dependent helicase IRC3